MEINKPLVEKILKINIDNQFVCSGFGLVNSKQKNIISFIDNPKYLSELNNNKNIIVVITNRNLSEFISKKKLIISEDPRYDFFSLINELGQINYKKTKSLINKNANIHPSAFISEFNVKIGNNTIVGPNVTILPDVEIGDDCFIQAGAVIGSEGFEYKRTSKGIISVYHDGKVIIGNNVAIGSNSTIVRGFSFKNTIIEKNVKIDNLTYIAHGAHIKKGSFIIGCSLISGSVVIEENVWVGPNSTISNSINIGENSFITLGSIVTKSVKANETIIKGKSIQNDVFNRIIKK